MRAELRIAGCVGALLGAGAARAGAQVRVSLSAGVVASSDLVRDSLVRTVAVRPSPAPMVALTIDAPLDPAYRLGLTISASHGALAYHGDSTSTVTNLTVWEPALRLSHRVTSSVALHGTLGIVLYRASTPAATLFQNGSPSEPTVGLGVDARWPIGRRFGIGASLDYSVHRFSTPALTADGFAGASTVHRLAVTVQLIGGGP